MSDNLVIVAIPAADDRVWKVSSEKVPHLTLLFLGEAENNPNVNRIFQFVHHAATTAEHGPFMLDVDYRDVLGDDEADVLHFRKDWSFKWIETFRNQLLQNTDIRAAYDSVEQYEEWLPHLTLGYPETPAKELGDDDHPIHWVSFDRIAVWTGNYEGPEFRLKWPERELTEVWMSDRVAAGADFIEHYGVKGMKWGQSKDTTVIVGGKTKQVSAKKAAKLDKKWEKQQFEIPKAVERHNKMSEHFNSRIGGLNDKYAKDDFSKEKHDSPALWSPRYKQYNDEVNKLQNDGYAKAIDSEPNSPTGRKRTTMEFTADGQAKVVIRDVDVAHAAGDETFMVKVTRNAKGLITKVEPVEEAMEQSAVVELGEEFLEHYGVKGMKWGVRNKRPLPQAVAPVATSKVPRGKKKKTKIKTEGGENHDASPDAIKVAEATAKLKRSGPAALSNRELREVADRVRLEQQVKELTAPRGRQFVKNLLRDQGQATAKSLLREEANKRTGVGGGKKN